MNEAVEKLKRFIFRRQHAYQNTFNAQNVLARTVLKDLAHFCRAQETAFHPDPRVHAVLEGRREVWLRIEKHLRLSSQELWSLYAKDIE